MVKLWSDFDKLRIVQQISRVNSRAECDTYSMLGDMGFGVPLVMAAMHSLVIPETVINMELAGSGVVQPRDYRYETKRPMFNSSIETSEATARYIEEKHDGKGLLFVEVANGLMLKYIKHIEHLRKMFPNLYIAAGTVMNYKGVERLYDAGANGVLVNIGNGSVCATTPYTGVGLPIISSLHEIFYHNNFNLSVDIIVSGGVRTIGDFVKCIALGADLVMSGSLFKHCYDTKVGDTGDYFGEASVSRKGNNHRVEGKHEIISYDEINDSVGDVIKLAKESLQSAMSYSDSFSLNEFRNKVVWNILE